MVFSDEYVSVTIDDAARAISDKPVQLRRTGLSSREIGGELIVLDLDSSRYLSVRGSGVLLVELLRTAHRPADLVAALTQRFAVDEDIARRDVARFLAELDAAGLLEHPA